MGEVVKKGNRKAKRKPAPILQNSTPIKEVEYTPRVWMKAFITSLSLRGIVTQACKAAKIERTTAYKARETDAVFAVAWDEAIEVAADALEAEAWRRAVDGVEKPVGFYKGEASEYVREHSDTLLIFLLKGVRPDKYRDNVKHEVGGTVRVLTAKDLDDDKLANIAAGAG